MKIFKVIFLSFASSLLLHANTSVSNADLSKKLDLILGKIGGLEDRVSNLESESSIVKKEVKQAAASAKEAKAASANLAIPADEKKRTSFFKDLRNKLQSEEDKASGPWAKKDSWAGLRRNLTRFQVRQILGDPHEVKTSLDPRIDQVYSYSGDLNADGENEEGVVNFFRDRLVSFKTPN
jgi:vacuolar-type H+-ATPase subunit I/STV1